MLRSSRNRTGQGGRFAFSSTPEQPSVLPSKTASVVEDRIVDGQCARENRSRLHERRGAHKGHRDNARRPAAHSQKSGAFLAPDCARAKRPYSSLSKEVLLRKEKPEATHAAAGLWGEGSSGTSDWMLWLENPSTVSRLQKARSQSNNIPRAGVPGARRRRQRGAYSNAQWENAAAGDRIGLQFVWAVAPAHSQSTHTHTEYTFVR